jgi:hypothetical protein
MKQFWSPASPYARKAREVAHERGLADRIDGSHRTAWWWMQSGRTGLQSKFPAKGN